MNKTVLYIILFNLCFSFKAQENLVYNGDFELYNECPTGFSDPWQNPKEIEKCLGWNAPTYGTSDYLNVCAAIGSGIEIPSDFLGFQMPFSGDGYLGGYFTNYTGGAGYDGYSGIMWWEYMQGSLKKTLEQGKAYRISMEVSVAEYSDLMINEFGVYFSANKISSQNTAALDLVPQVKFFKTEFYTDTLNWMHVEGIFVADGNEKYLMIGNFRDNIATDTLRRYNREPEIENPHKTYMFVDDVHLVLDEDALTSTNVFSPNGDGINEHWFSLANNQFKGRLLTILDRWGNIIYEADAYNFSWDGKTHDGKNCSEGTYFYRINSTTKTGFIQLVR